MKKVSNYINIEILTSPKQAFESQQDPEKVDFLFLYQFYMCAIKYPHMYEEKEAVPKDPKKLIEAYKNNFEKLATDIFVLTHETNVSGAETFAIKHFFKVIRNFGFKLSNELKMAIHDYTYVEYSVTVEEIIVLLAQDIQSSVESLPIEKKNAFISWCLRYWQILKNR